MALFIYLSVWLYGGARVPGHPYRLAALFLSIACACFSKETAFFYLPMFFFMVESTRILESTGARGAMALSGSQSAVPTGTAVRKALAGWPAALTAGAALAAVWYLRHRAMPVTWCITGEPLAPSARVGTTLVALGRHVLNLVSPLAPQVSDSLTITGITSAVPLLVAAICLIVFILALRKGIGSPVAAMIFLAAISLFPALNLLPLPRFYSPHYAYLAVAPVTGRFIVLFRSARRFVRPPLHAAPLVLATTWIVIALITTIQNGNRLQSDLTLFMPEVIRDSRFSEGWFYCGNCLRATGRFGEAQTAYNEGLLPAPGCIRFYPEMELLINQSALAVQRNDLVSADSLMLIAREHSAAAFQPDIAFIRADIAMRAGEYDTVIALLANKEENLQRPEACRLLGDALSVRGNKEEAEKMYLRGSALADSSSR